MTPHFDLQPTLSGPRLELRPLRPDDWAELFAAASDPLIWDQHPEPTRYQEAVFRKYFEGAMKSGGALAILDRAEGRIVGCSRYYDYESSPPGKIVVGYTFLIRAYWGNGYNRELKTLMLGHAFRSVGKVELHAGEHNHRSRRAIEKLGGRKIGEKRGVSAGGVPVLSIVYEVTQTR